MREIAAVPLDRAGLNQLDRIAHNAPVGEMTREEVDSYNAAFGAKRNAINAGIRSEHAAAKQASATLPAPVQEQLAAVLTGDSVDALSLRGLRPGMDYAKVRAMALSGWKSGSGLESWSSVGCQQSGIQDLTPPEL